MQPAQQDSQPILNIVGQKGALGPCTRELLPLYMRWINDFEATYTLLPTIRPMTLEAQQVWYERIVKSETEVVFTIYELATLRPIGTSGLHGIDHVHCTAEFGVLIGEKDCWGRGYGMEVTTLVLDYAFAALGLHNVLLRVYSFNERARRAYLRAGFREMGRRRESRRLAGQAYDTVYMDCLATEFQSPVLRRVLAPRES